MSEAPIPLGVDQAPALAALHAGAFDTPWSVEAIAALTEQPGVAAIGTTDGFVLVRVVLDEAEILTLAVDPAARRRGLGRRLTEAAADWAAAQGAERLFLEVAEDNLAARGLYLATGFGEDGRRRGYYARPDGPAVDALLLTLKLAGRLPTA